MELSKNTNPQDVLINSHEGIYLVDAGAGTGKTYSIVRRYSEITGRKTPPDKILLITFTKNAAEQMRDEVISNLASKVSITKLLEAPIMTFHSFCTKILKSYGSNSPRYAGIKEYISDNFTVLEDETVEQEIFRKFYYSFVKIKKPLYSNVIQTIEDNNFLILKLIKKLCSHGIFPHSDGWSKDDLKRLKGNFEKFSDIFDDLNQPLLGSNDNEIFNKLRNNFKSATDNNLYSDFEKSRFLDSTTLDPEVKEEIFYDNSQEELIKFTADIYFSYTEYLLKKNLLNFEFMIMFAFLVLFHNNSVRKKIQYDYVMVDEFQDTDEIQMKLIMLACKSIKGNANLCVVGDWKQGIYGFRNTSIENITEFSGNLKMFKEQLNESEIRIEYDVSKHKKIVFENNYRSSDALLKFSIHTLKTEASKDEEIDINFIENNFKKPLLPKRNLDDLTETKFYAADSKQNEYRLVLQKISEITDSNSHYRIKEFNKEGKEIAVRPVRYSDICVLSRTKNFCLEFQREAMKHGIPVNYKGGLELFSSVYGIIVLAWLRLILNEKDIYGWLPVLDMEGFNFPEIMSFKDYLTKDSLKNSYDMFAPSVELIEFLSSIKKYESNILFAVEAILKRYNLNDSTGDKIVSIIKTWINSELISLNELVKMIDKSGGAEYETELVNSTNAVLTQSIHAAKGLEYPVVILSNMNIKNFPGTKSEYADISFNPVSGLRMKYFYGNNGRYYYKFRNWKSDLLNAVLKKSDYDEERRLLYVAVTRAKQYLFFTSYNPSLFFLNLSAKGGFSINKNFNYEINKTEETVSYTDIEIPVPGTSEKIRQFISVHKIMNSEMEEPEISIQEENKSKFLFRDSGMGMGIIIHEAANRIANKIYSDEENEYTKKIKHFIDGLNADNLLSEVSFLYPKDDKLIRGTIDLLAFYKDRIEIIDYKTDANKKYIDRYKIQIEIYKEAVQSIYKEMKVKGKIYFVKLGEIIEV